MILIEIDKNCDTYTLHDTSNDNEWVYEDEYQYHHIDSDGMLHIEFTSSKLELPVGCCILSIKDEEE